MVIMLYQRRTYMTNPKNYNTNLYVYYWWASQGERILIYMSQYVGESWVNTIQISYWFKDSITKA